MGALDFLVHILNFAAPAVVIALLVTALARIIWRKKAFAHVLYREFAINIIVCLFLSLASLWYFGRDGTITGYAALVAGCATSQWWLLRKN